MRLIAWGKRIDGKWTFADGRDPDIVKSEKVVNEVADLIYDQKDMPKLSPEIEKAFLEDEALRMQELAKLDEKIARIIIEKRKAARAMEFERLLKLH